MLGLLLQAKTPDTVVHGQSRGNRVRKRDVAECRHKQNRLASMGLRPGDRIEIINNTGGGRVILGLDNTRLAIGRGMAKRIMVSPVQDASKS
jgi:Fur family ferric uptake transcriptional regulator